MTRSTSNIIAVTTMVIMLAMLMVGLAVSSPATLISSVAIGAFGAGVRVFAARR
jgi:hypothetical protein